MRPGCSDYIGFGATGIGDDGLRFEMWGYGLHDARKLADRGRQHHYIRSTYSFFYGGRFVNDAKLDGFSQGIHVTSGADDPVNLPGLFQGERNRSAYQADSQNR
jgi:hypothetical protein